jgi:hypothetical protein
MQYPPDDAARARADAAAALLAALRDVRDANDRLQFAAAFVLEAFGDSTDAETIRMLPVGGPARPGKPAVPPPAPSRHLADDRPPVELPGGLYVPADVADVLEEIDPSIREPLTSPAFVTGDESGDDKACPHCGSTLGRDRRGLCNNCGRAR